MHGQIVFKSILVILVFSSLKGKYIKIIINLCNWVHNIKGCNLQYFSGGSDGKSICLQCGRPRFDPGVGKIPWRRKWQPTLVFLPGNSYGQQNLVGYRPWGRKELDTTERLHFHFSFLQQMFLPF